MPPRWESPFDPSPRDAARLAEVLGAAQSHHTEPSGDGTDDGGVDDAMALDIRELISSAVAKVHRGTPTHRHESGVAPVLGSGVAHELLRRKRESGLDFLNESVPSVDERR